MQSRMNAFNDLFNLWQDACYPGLGRPFKLVHYVSDDRIVIADTRQGNAKQYVSLNMLRSAIDRRQLENRFDAIQRDVAAKNKKMAETADASVRKQLSDHLKELTKESKDVRKKMDEIGS